MWHSADDLVRDLMYLNDFGNPTHPDQYKVFCTVGRGSKQNMDRPSTAEFVDPRTGDIINSKTEIQNSNTLYKGFSKGRGKGLNESDWADYQLQKQLKLIRPNGSSDREIESYFYNNVTPKYIKTMKEKNKNKNKNVKNEINIFMSDPQHFPILKPLKRVKAIRSERQSNALISSLLSRNEESSNE